MRASLLAMAFMLMPRLTWACATCFGAEGDPQTEGLNMAIITLLGVTYTLFSAMALLVFLKWRKNIRALEEANPDLSVVSEGSPTHG